MQRDDIGIALAHYSHTGGCHSCLGLVDAIENLGFMEDGRLLRIEVLGLTVPYDAATERYAFSIDIVYGKHDPLIEPVPELATVAYDHIRLNHLRWLESK